MALHINVLSYDSRQKQAQVVVVENDVPRGTTLNAFFPMDTTGSETQNQIDEMMKQKAKELFQAAAALL